VSANALKATLSNNTSGVVGLKYTFGNAAFYSGWEYILFANPSDAYADGFTAIGNYPVPAGFVNSTAYAEHGPASNIRFGTISTSPAPIITIIRTTMTPPLARMADSQRRAAVARSTPSPQ
jgi:hypothetical protein